MNKQDIVKLFLQKLLTMKTQSVEIPMLWIAEIISTIESLTAELDSLRKAYAVTNESWKKLAGENEQLQQENKSLQDEIEEHELAVTIESPVCVNKIDGLIKKLDGYIAQKKEFHNPADVAALKQAKELLEKLYPANIFTGVSGDEIVLEIVDLRKAIDKALEVGE